MLLHGKSNSFDPHDVVSGVDWHPNLQMKQNLITRGDLPRCVMDSYEECRGPPRLFLLDKYVFLNFIGIYKIRLIILERGLVMNWKCIYLPDLYQI